MRVALFFLIGACACSSPNGCHGTVPEGNIDLALGARGCIGGVGYLCTGPNFVQEDDGACRTQDASTRDVTFHPNADARPRG